MTLWRAVALAVGVGAAILGLLVLQAFAMSHGHRDNVDMAPIGQTG